MRVQKRGTAMTGIQFLTDEKGRKVAAVIDLKKHRALWEDIQDVLVSQSRKHEKRIPWEKVKADLVKQGKLRGRVSARIGGQRAKGIAPPACHYRGPCRLAHRKTRRTA